MGPPATDYLNMAPAPTPGTYCLFGRMGIGPPRGFLDDNPQARNPYRSAPMLRVFYQHNLRVLRRLCTANR